MIEKNHSSLSVGAQCHLLSISRSSFYDEPMGETAMNLDLMVVIEKQFLETPFYGAQQMTWHLQNEGPVVNQKRIRRLMRLMRVRRENGPPDRFVRPARDHELRSGSAVHVLRLDRPPETGRHPDLDGWQGPVHRQPSGIHSDRWRACPRSSNASGAR